ncbi:hypothetical protein NE237_016581 [Protea cynaroides]|uniref:Plantacyanin n=1 Tax=Protea cynaroides TaxID=273540 RepID=A0A9Q0HE41_9MAGN|nr:hypothetical protein NE237_016581 [Protea cynaroides]
MAQGKGNVAGTVIVVIALLGLMIHCEIVNAATQTINWTFNVVNWPQGKNFTAGDTIVFNYAPSTHNVVVVDANGYTSCKIPTGAKVFTSGNDQITLAKGQNYFICGFPGHCGAGVKIAVNAV